jgi:hypothetical protein
VSISWTRFGISILVRRVLFSTTKLMSDYFQVTRVVKPSTYCIAWLQCVLSLLCSVLRRSG